MLTRKQLTGRLHAAAIAYANASRRFYAMSKEGPHREFSPGVHDVLSGRLSAERALLKAAFEYGRPPLAKPQSEREVA